MQDSTKEHTIDIAVPGVDSFLASSEEVDVSRTADDAFYDAFFRSKFDAIYRICLHLLNDADAANDATSDVLEKIIPKLPCANICNFDAWLRRVAYNTAIDHLRSIKRRNQTPFDDSWELADESSIPEEIVLNGELHDLLHDQLERLTPNQRQVFLLKQDLPAKEIAVLLDRSESWMNTTYWRTLQTLRANLDGNRP